MISPPPESAWLHGAEGLATHSAPTAHATMMNLPLNVEAASRFMQPFMGVPAAEALDEGATDASTRFLICLDDLLANPDDHECACRLLSLSADSLHAAALFEAAVWMRDDRIGRRLQASAVIAARAVCEISPPCHHSFHCPLDHAGRVPHQAALETLPLLAGLGLRHLHLNAPPDLGEDDDRYTLIEAAAALGLLPIVTLDAHHAASDPASLLSAGVDAVAIRSEVSAAHYDLMDACEQAGVSFEAEIILGLGETLDDHVRYLRHLRTYRKLRRISFTRFRPSTTACLADRVRCSSWTMARLTALARLMLPACEIGLGVAVEAEADELPLWFAAGGGGGRVHAVTVCPRQESDSWMPEGRRLHAGSHITLIDRRPLLHRTLAEMGAELSANWGEDAA